MDKPRFKQLAMFKDEDGKKIPPPNVSAGKRRSWGGYAHTPGGGPDGKRCEHCKFLAGNVCNKAIEFRTGGRFSENENLRKEQERRLRQAAGTISPTTASCKYFVEAA